MERNILIGLRVISNLTIDYFILCGPQLGAAKLKKQRPPKSATNTDAPNSRVDRSARSSFDVNLECDTRARSRERWVSRPVKSIIRQTLKERVMKISAFLLALAFVTVSTASAQSQSTPILSSAVEGSTRGAKIASLPIVNAVLNASDKDRVKELHECMSENHIEKDKANKFFVSVRLPSIIQNQEIYFVRPALDPSCHAFYGAHAFYYWLVSLDSGTYNVRYRGFSDDISILRSIHKGMYDIEPEYVTGFSASTATMQFNGSKYVSTKCKEKHRTKRGKEVVRIIPCSTL